LKAELLARISGNLARIGKFDEARQCIAELRRDYAGEKSGPATVWIMLAEGLLHLFSDLNPVALDRVARAQILGLALKYPAAIALSSAWKAHLEFESSQFEAMVKSIRLGLHHAKAEDLDAQVRFAMVLANAFMIAGDRSMAQIWFAKARDHAVKNGDQASIEALLYNRTTFGIAASRSDRCIDGAERADLTITRKEVESTINFHELTKSGALTNHIHLWSARLSILEGNYRQAIIELTSARKGAPFADYNFSQQLIDLEMTYCLAQVGEIDEALLVFGGVDLDSINRLDLDEQLVGASMLCELETLNEKFKRGNDAQNRLDELRLKYVSNRNLLRSSLNEWASQ
jgi:tetratricopeptide (TPR) repeat protein